jgi:hypothetical protein
MSCGNHHNLPCTDVLHAIVLYIDHEIEDNESVHAIELHIQECPPCAARTAQEAILNEQLRRNVGAMIRQPQFEWHQSITYTEITTDTFIHTHVEIHERFGSDDDQR